MSGPNSPDDPVFYDLRKPAVQMLFETPGD